MEQEKLSEQYIQQLYTLVAFIRAGYYKSNAKALLIEQLKKLIKENINEKLS